MNEIRLEITLNNNICKKKARGANLLSEKPEILLFPENIYNSLTKKRDFNHFLEIFNKIYFTEFTCLILQEQGLYNKKKCKNCPPENCYYLMNCKFDNLLFNSSLDKLSRFLYPLFFLGIILTVYSYLSEYYIISFLFSFLDFLGSLLMNILCRIELKNIEKKIFQWKEVLYG